MAIIFPSLISADLLNLERTINQLEPYCAGFHLDIMDNHFVPNLTWGTMFIDAIGRCAAKQLWVHLMVDNPSSWATRMHLPAQSIVSFHLESLLSPPTTACHHTCTQETSSTNPIHQNSSLVTESVIHLIKLIQNENWRASIAINPETPIAALFPFLRMLDHVLIMSVHPGASGQSFLPTTDHKVKELTDYCTANKLHITISVDGGITPAHCARLQSLGVHHFAAAAAIFHTPDPVKALQELQKI